jgi:hypothetical protein
LPIEFQYEVGNDIFLNAQKIESGEPENDMKSVLMDSTTLLVEEVVADTFRRRGLRSGAVDVRVLEVTYSNGTTSIGNFTDIREHFVLTTIRATMPFSDIFHLHFFSLPKHTTWNRTLSKAILSNRIGSIQ